MSTVTAAKFPSGRILVPICKEKMPSASTVTPNWNRRQLSYGGTVHCMTVCVCKDDGDGDGDESSFVLYVSDLSVRSVFVEASDSHRTTLHCISKNAKKFLIAR